MRSSVVSAFFVSLLLVAVAARGDEPRRPSAASLIAAQKAAMQPLAMMNGIWRGTAWTLLPDGKKHVITQTERIGPFLDGSVKVIEGRGYDADGSVSFNALGIISYDVGKKAYSIHSHAMGMSGTFPLEPKANGYVWTVPAGPGATIRYTAEIREGKWREIGESIVEGKEPMKIFEMNLVCIGDTEWPAAGAVSAK